MRVSKWASLLLVVGVLSCNKGVMFNEVKTIPNEGWDKDSMIVFDISISDTINAYDIIIHCRNTNDYAYNNVWLFIETVAPTKNSLRDTLELKLASSEGWIGKGLGNKNDISVPYKRNIYFPYKGVYTFKIKHDMLEGVLKEIMNIGLKVSRHNSK